MSKHQGETSWPLGWLKVNASRAMGMEFWLGGYSLSHTTRLYLEILVLNIASAMK